MFHSFPPPQALGRQKSVEELALDKFAEDNSYLTDVDYIRGLHKLQRELGKEKLNRSSSLESTGSNTSVPTPSVSPIIPTRRKISNG